MNIKPNKNRLAFIASLNLDGVIDFCRANALWTKYETEIQSLVRDNGPHYALDRYKACYLFLRNTVLELPTQPIPYCKLDSNGIPKPLWTLRPLLKGNRDSKRLALSIARSYEIIRLEVDYSVSSIIDSPNYGVTVDREMRLFKKFLTEFSRKYPWYLGSLQSHNPNDFRVFTGLGQGPNGPAVASAHLDARAVIDEPNLHIAIRNLNQVLGQSWITSWMERMAKSSKSKETLFTGRLGFSAEPGGKTRIFAIADYWSQISLKVIQISLYNTLKAISTDCTADQDKGFKSLLKESAGRRTYCFDLSSASDRIPAVMQAYRLELLGGRLLGESWLSIMTDRDFYIKARKQYVRWSVGQPLGLLSSFPSFALWHHDIVQFAANRDRILKGKPLKFFSQYRLLGDDLVIFNTKVAGNYQQLVTDVFGISINMQKSVLGDKKNSQIEFTKRFALRGKEMSSLKPNILSKRKLSDMLDLIDLLIERDFITPDTGHHRLYPFLTSQEQTRFNYMLWVRTGSPLPFTRDDGTYLFDRDQFEVKLKEVRSQNLMAKTTLIDKYLSAAKPLNELFGKVSLPDGEKVLGLGDISNSLELHPLVWAINQTGLDLSIALSTIWDDECPNVSPVEYLPIISPQSYFVSPRKRMTEYLSKVLIDVFNELSKEPNGLK